MNKKFITFSSISKVNILHISRVNIFLNSRNYVCLSRSPFDIFLGVQLKTCAECHLFLRNFSLLDDKPEESNRLHFLNITLYVLKLLCASTQSLVSYAKRNSSQHSSFPAEFRSVKMFVWQLKPDPEGKHFFNSNHSHLIER